MFQKSPKFISSENRRYSRFSASYKSTQGILEVAQSNFAYIFCKKRDELVCEDFPNILMAVVIWCFLKYYQNVFMLLIPGQGLVAITSKSYYMSKIKFYLA